MGGPTMRTDQQDISKQFSLFWQTRVRRKRSHRRMRQELQRLEGVECRSVSGKPPLKPRTWRRGTAVRVEVAVSLRPRLVSRNPPLPEGCKTVSFRIVVDEPPKRRGRVLSEVMKRGAS